MRTSAAFSHTVRSGVRNGRRNLVLYAVSTLSDAPSQVGFIVAKTVGNAVTRNLVKRRLREIAVESVRRYPKGIHVVVRALPASAGASWGELVDDYHRAFAKVESRLPGLPKGNSVQSGQAGTTTADEKARRIEGEEVRDPSQA